MAREKLIQLRRGTANEWQTVNPILASGETGFETDTDQLKIGDGVTAWNDLSYVRNKSYERRGFKYHEFACSDEESDLEVATVYDQRLLRAFNDVTRIDFGVKTAPTGSMIVLDVLKNGMSIFTTKPRIDIGAFTTLVPPSGMPEQAIIGGSVNFAQGDLLTVKIDQVGSTTAGTNLKAQITYK